MRPGEDFARIRFAGDSGDGIQLTGSRFAQSALNFGNDFATFPDFPAEIRAPLGTVYGVSSYSINIGSGEIRTHGDQVDMLVAFNPAALKVNLGDVREGGTILVDESTFNERVWKKAHYDANPLDDEALSKFQVIAIDMSGLTQKVLSHMGLSRKQALQSKNMWALGLVLEVFGRQGRSVIAWLNEKFKDKPKVLEANLIAFKAGRAYAEVEEMAIELPHFEIEPAPLEAGNYRLVPGHEALAMGLYAGARLAGLKMFYGSYPITPASNILHNLARMQDDNLTIFQAEDEIAAICAAIGASYAGGLGVTTSSGPGIALKTEALGLALATEMPLIVVNVQRGGPSTGLPTKSEQSDLNQAVYGRNGDTPLPVIAIADAADSFDAAIEAVRIAVTSMTPVILLSDGYIANAALPWAMPDLSDEKYKPFPVSYCTDPDACKTTQRNPDTLAKSWVKPGTPGLMQRIGGLEKDAMTGAVSYDPANHQAMTDIRVGKIAAIAAQIPPQEVSAGPPKGKLVVVTWGSPYGAARIAVKRSLALGRDVSHIQLRHLSPFPANLKQLLAGFEAVLVPELNAGQLAGLMRSRLLRDVVSLTKVEGQPFKVSEIMTKIAELTGAST